MLPSLRRLVWTIPVCLAATASVAGAFVRLAPEKDGAVDLIATRAERAPRADVQQALSRGTAWREFQGRYGQWRALWNEATSTPHRALPPVGRDRYAIPFFLGPHLDTVIACAPSCRGPENPPRFPPISYDDYLRWWYDANYRPAVQASAD